MPGRKHRIFFFCRGAWHYRVQVLRARHTAARCVIGSSDTTVFFFFLVHTKRRQRDTIRHCFVPSQHTVKCKNHKLTRNVALCSLYIWARYTCRWPPSPLAHPTPSPINRKPHYHKKKKKQQHAAAPTTAFTIKRAIQQRQPLLPARAPNCLYLMCASVAEHTKKKTQSYYRPRRAHTAMFCSTRNTRTIATKLVPSTTQGVSTPPHLAPSASTNENASSDMMAKEIYIPECIYIYQRVPQEHGLIKREKKVYIYIEAAVLPWKPLLIDGGVETKCCLRALPC